MMDRLGLSGLQLRFRRWTELFQHEPQQALRLMVTAAGGLVLIGLWGLYGDLLLSNLVVVAGAELMLIALLLTLATLLERLVRSHDSWQVQAALAYRQLLTETRPFSGEAQVGSPFYARRFEAQLQEELSRCRSYATPLTVVAFRLEMPGQAPTHAVFNQANMEVAEQLSAHHDRLIMPTALGMFEYAFYLPNCDKTVALQIADFLAGKLRRYRCTFGFASFPQHGDDARALLGRAVQQCGVLSSNVA